MKTVKMITPLGVMALLMMLGALSYVEASIESSHMRKVGIKDNVSLVSPFLQRSSSDLYQLKGTKHKIDGYYIHHSAGMWNWIYVTSDGSFSANLDGVRDTNYGTNCGVNTDHRDDVAFHTCVGDGTNFNAAWAAVTFESIKISDDGKEITFGALKKSESRWGNVTKLANTTQKIDGYYVHYGAGAFDWAYMSDGQDFVAKLEGATFFPEDTSTHHYAYYGFEWSIARSSDVGAITFDKAHKYVCFGTTCSGAKKLVVTALKLDNDNDGIIDQIVHYTYDKYGNRVTHSDDQDADGIVDTYAESTYNANGDEIFYRQDYNNDGTFELTETRTYDANNNLIKDVYVDEYLGEYFTIYCTYKNSKRMTKKQDFGSDGIMDSVATYEYDAQGNNIKVSEDQNNDGVVDLVATYLYDDNGKVKLESLDIDNDGTVDQVTASIRRDGILVSTIVSNSLGEVVFEERNSYDSNGNVTGISYYFDGSNTPGAVEYYTLEEL
jgi:hypothetical protein